MRPEEFKVVAVVAYEWSILVPILLVILMAPSLTLILLTWGLLRLIGVL